MEPLVTFFPQCNITSTCNVLVYELGVWGYHHTHYHTIFNCVNYMCPPVSVNVDRFV